MTVEEQLVVHEGLGLAVGRCMVLFYADDRVVGSRDPERLQGEMNVLIVLFRRYGLVANYAKSKAIPCQLGILRFGM